MDVLTLLWANIRQKKGTCLSILLLTAIIVSAAVSIFSLDQSFNKDMQTAWSKADAPDVSSFLTESRVTPELLEQVEAFPQTERVTCRRGLVSGDNQIGDSQTGSTYFYIGMPPDTLLFREDFSGLEPAPPLAPGEIYVPYGLAQGMNCRIGDTLTATFGKRTYSFRIRGFVQEPTLGASLIGFKLLFISDQDLETYRAQALEDEQTDTEQHITGCVLGVYKKADCDLSDQVFLRQLNRETKLSDLAIGTLTHAQSVHYTGLMQRMVLRIMLAFVGLLFLIVLIVIAHSIQSEMELDYVKLGVLKAQGFTGTRIGLILALQYLLAELLGAVLGICIAMPIVWKLSGLFMQLSGFLYSRSLSVLCCLAVPGAVLFLSLLVLLWRARSISRISPVRAISGGREAVWFDSRLRMPISRRFLSGSLAVRQVVCAKRRYAGALLVVSILVFFILTASGINNLIQSPKMYTSLGQPVIDMSLTFNQSYDQEMEQTLRQALEPYGGMESICVSAHQYMSMNGENLQCAIYLDSAMIQSVIQGRAPAYDNECLVTELVCDALDLHIGDQVTVSGSKGEATFMISGIYQDTNDAGMCFAITYDGYARIFPEPEKLYATLAMNQPERNVEAAKYLNTTYPELMQAEAVDMTSLFGYDFIFEAMGWLIDGFSLVFAAVVAWMMSSKMFARERTELGVYRSLGFTVTRLRVQFALRFALIGAVGSLIGFSAARLWASKVVEAVTRQVGIFNLQLVIGGRDWFFALMLTTVTIAVSAFLASRRIRTLSVRTLVTE